MEEIEIFSSVTGDPEVIEIRKLKLSSDVYTIKSMHKAWELKMSFKETELFLAKKNWQLQLKASTLLKEIKLICQGVDYKILVITAKIWDIRQTNTLRES